MDAGSGACARARASIHAWLDGEASVPTSVEEHLASCVSCRALRDELGIVQRALRSLPHEPMPAAALDEVWRRTSRASERPASPQRRAGLDWRVLAAAAVLALALLGGLRERGLAPAAADEEELARAAAEARLVLSLSAGAIRRTERAAVHQVLLGQVGPALERVPIDFPSEDPRRRRGDRGDHV
jgi:anti-sigma factor RsiW